jgi:hypothetical protein
MIWSSCLFIGFAKLFLSRQSVYHLLQLLAVIAPNFLLRDMWLMRFMTFSCITNEELANAYRLEGHLDQTLFCHASMECIKNVYLLPIMGHGFSSVFSQMKWVY